MPPRPTVSPGGVELAAPQPGMLRKEFVVRDSPFFAQCHASTLVALPGGRLLAAWFGGTREGHEDVAIWLAGRTEQGWTEPGVVADEPGLPHWNPVLFRPGPDTVYLFYKVGRRIPTWQTRLLRSGDGGATWSGPVELVPGERGGRGPVRNKPIVVGDGSWLAPASVEGEVWDAFVDVSTDQGRTWQASEKVPLDHHSFPGPGVIQPTLWESAPGVVHMLLRSTSGWVCRSDSTDYGRTWSPVYATSLPNNNSALDVVRRDDGSLVLVHNPVGANWGPRTPLVASRSWDNGVSWDRLATLEDEAPDGAASITPAETGVVTDGAAEFS